MKLTTKKLTAIAKHKPEKSFEDFPDGNGLICRIYKTGRMAWYSRYRFEKKPQILKHGEYPAMSLNEARNLNFQLKDMIAMGINPIDDRNNDLTVNDAWKFWIDNYAKKNRKNTAGIEKMYAKHLAPVIGERDLSSVTKRDWIKTLNGINAPVTARTLYKNMNQVCRYLEAQDMIESNVLGKVPASFIGSKPKARDRVLTRKELKQLMDAKDKGRKLGRKWRLAIMVIMLSGCRSHELRESNKSHFNFDEGIWIVPKQLAKEGEEIVRPITKHLEPLLKELMLYSNREGNLFTSKSGEIITPENFYSGCKNFCHTLDNPCTPHMFRHSMSTHFSDLRIPPFIGERCLGHKMGGVLAVYNKGRYLEEIADALNKYHDWIASA